MGETAKRRVGDGANGVLGVALVIVVGVVASKDGATEGTYETNVVL